jgi:hypothetical protein
MRSVLAALAMSACMIGCEREVFEHAQAVDLLSDGGGRDASDGAASDVDCKVTGPGTRCDDDNVCTPVSTCRDLQCLGGTSSRQCTLADADSRVPDEQGQLGWHFGYWNADRDEDGYYDSETARYCSIAFICAVMKSTYIGSSQRSACAPGAR